MRELPPGLWLSAYVAALAALLLAGGGASWATSLARLADWPLKAAAIWVAVAIARSQVHARRVRQGWGLVGLAVAVLLLGEISSHAVVLADPRSPLLTWTSALYLFVHPLLIAAFLRLQRLFESREAALTFVLDAVIVMLGTAIVLWLVFLAEPLGTAFATTNRAQLLVALAYPAGDLLLLFAVATILLRRPIGAVLRVYVWLTGAIACALLGDLLWTRSVAGGSDPLASRLAQLCWLVAPWCLAMGGLLQLRNPAREPEGGRGREFRVSLLPYGATTLVAAVVVGEALAAERASTSVVLLLAATTFLAVLGRQAVTQRRSLRLAREKAARDSAVQRDALLEHSADAILVVDRDRTVRYANPGFERMIGRPVREGEPFPPTIAEADRAHLEVMLRRTGGAGPHRARLRLDRAGQEVIVEAAISEYGGEGGAGELIINLRDVTPQVALEEQLSRRMLRDPLTDLPNRALFMDRVAQALGRAIGPDRSVAVLLADLDRFKIVNDTRGHAAGDAVLVQAAKRLVDAVPARATVARAADDEFAILLEGELSIDTVTRVAETVRASFDAPFDAAGASMVVTASVGLAGPSRGDTAEELIRKADVAMNQAKNGGRNKVMAFEARIDRALGSRTAMLSGLRQALAHRRIDVAFQPIYDVGENRLFGLEALARWVDPEQGRVAPGVFIAVAEDGGLMLELGAMIFERALEHAQRVEREFVLSVNISVQQLADHAFSGLIVNALEAARWPPGRLLLEMTESVLAEDRRVVRRNLAYLRDAGVRIAIDDFGTGYSSLSQLHDVPVDVLKIDRRFIDQIETRAGSETVRAVMAIGRALNLEIIAEGVEKESQLAVLKELGCRYIQGFLFGQPLFADDLQRLSTRVR